MAKRIPFNVIYASEEAIDYPSSELNTHGPTVHGWRSKSDGGINMVLTQELIIHFHYPAKVSRIQVLAHQYLIPERIELWIHYSPPNTDNLPTTPSSQSFEYLGFIALSDNSSTQYKSRELQSVSVGHRNGTHLKLRLGPAQKNEFNKTNQISLIAINVLGEEYKGDDINRKSNTDEATTENSSNTNNNNDCDNKISDQLLQSICDDLSFSMYVEESINDLVRELETKKYKAVEDERFEYARKLKLCMNVLRSAGERMGRYALAKRQAVQQEDFTTAKLRKEQMEMYKTMVYDHLQVDRLLEKNGCHAEENDKICELYSQKPILPGPPSLQDVARIIATETTQLIAATATSIGTVLSSSSSQSIYSPTKNSQKETVSSSVDSGQSTEHSSSTCTSSSKASITPNSPLLNQIGRSPIHRGSPTAGSLRRRNKSAPRNSYEDYEERTVPALRHSHTNEFLRECQGAAILENDMNRGRSRLNDREKRQAALPILVFGYDMVELFYSRQFQDREEGLTRLRNILKGEESIDFSIGANKIARSSTLLLHRAVRDAVFSVFCQATETVRALFVEFVPNRVMVSEVSRCVDRLLPELLAKSGDPSPRIHTLAQHTILSIASCPEVRQQHLIAPALSRSVGSGTHPRLALSRMQMLEQIVLNHGISTDKQSGLTCRSLTECGCSGIHHPAESVRKVAERVLLLVYKQNPRIVRKQLPPDDDITRRNLLYRQLFTEFDKIDVERRKEMMLDDHGNSNINKNIERYYDSSKSQIFSMNTNNRLEPFSSNSSSPLPPPIMIASMTTSATGTAAITNINEHRNKSVRYDCNTTNNNINNNKQQQMEVNNFEPLENINNNQNSPMKYATAMNRVLKSKSGTAINNNSNNNNNVAVIMTDNQNIPGPSKTLHYSTATLHPKYKLKYNIINNNSNRFGLINGNKKQQTIMLSSDNSRQSSNSDSFDDTGGGGSGGGGGGDGGGGDATIVQLTENHCTFCDWTYYGDDISQLDKHYWKACPILTKCPQCGQVIEVAALNLHLINECESKDNYRICHKCREAIRKDFYKIHLMEKYCVELKTGAARCPLCHEDVHLPLDGGWKLHLLNAKGCPGNARRRSKL